MAITSNLVTPNTTLDTVADYITDARVLLLDQTAPFRYDDPSLLEALNLMLLEGRRLRADLFVHNRRLQGRVPVFKINDNSLVPIEDQFRLGFLYGMVGHAIARDQEDIQDERAVSFMNIMSNVLTGKNIVTPQAAGGA
jgi:hypothetical protein